MEHQPMNTTATEIAAQASNAATKGRKATTGKRRMAREASNPATTGTPSAPDEPQAAATSARATSKIATVIGLLAREQGATLAEMVEATGWLPHTTRAALTGLKKKGHTLTKDKRGDVTCYRIVKAG
jgi:hypothetical protein